MKLFSLLVCLLIFSGKMVSAQVTDVFDDKIPGVWVLSSVKFGGPVDINKDGLKSDDAIKEYDSCRKDQRFYFGANKDAKTMAGSTVPGCQSEIETYTWKVVKKKIREAHYENGRRIVNEVEVLVLVLRSTTDNDGVQYRIDNITRKEMKLRMELNDGNDSTAEARVIFKKVKE
ncbi:hypothetical protein CLV59_102636 [Chitinophaga dinghuensis]|uniref:Lipocalin-like protein n=1 Tax=Chitinophaga dinghuensis TaxID=1539050 RepID=A0A327W5Y9_9BACT|nr:hypothetical protein [Chitinophaga dinghuensis]RAJ85929.1 hypothetical protein CLV59_102636 [Chitinophaga dinghuensis]